jgi:hypothetical protein
MNNKTIIEFGLRRIPELFRPRSMLSAEAENIDLGLNNSGYPAQPHPIIVKNYTEILSPGSTFKYEISLKFSCRSWSFDCRSWS